MSKNKNESIDMSSTAMEPVKPGALAPLPSDLGAAIVSGKDLLADAAAQGASLEKYFSLAKLAVGQAVRGVWLGESGTVTVSNPQKPGEFVEMATGRIRVGKGAVAKIKLIGDLKSIKPGTYIGIMKGELVTTNSGRKAQDWTVISYKSAPAELVVDGDLTTPAVSKSSEPDDGVDF